MISDDLFSFPITKIRKARLILDQLAHLRRCQSDFETNISAVESQMAVLSAELKDIQNRTRKHQASLSQGQAHVAEMEHRVSEILSLFEAYRAAKDDLTDRRAVFIALAQLNLQRDLRRT